MAAFSEPNAVITQSTSFFIVTASQAGFPPRRTGFEPGSGHVGFVVDKVALGQVFS
jgi:hypothetical protein